VRATFSDAGLDAQLGRDGFATVPMLDPDEVAALRATFERLGAAPGDPHLACHSSFHTNDSEYKRAVDREVRGALSPHLDRLFDRQRALPCNFISKWPSAMSGFGLHQDLSLVDERAHRSVEVWVALDDTDAHNGQLWMVPGSHRWLPTNIRGINGFGFAFADVTRRIIQRHAVPVPIPAGHAVVFDHAVLHFSLPNRSDAARLVAITDLIPEEAPHLHYFGNPDGGIDVYEIGDEFWTDNNPFTLWKPPPSSQLVATIARRPVRLSDADLDDLVAAGAARETGMSPKGAPNAAKPWCHRCGTTIADGAAPDRWVGNVTMLCGTCRELEIAHAATREHVVARVP
jgi:hypothetical protein